MSLLPLPSLAVFCPQSKAPKESYLDQMHSYLSGKEVLKPFMEAAMDLSETWSIFASHREDIAEMNRGPVCIQALSDWIAYGNAASVLNNMSGVLALPLLTIIQIGQYFQFLELKDLSHSELLEHLQSGGIQGYCGGLLPAIAIASSSDETELIFNASKCLRIALAMGAYSELGGDEFSYGSTTMVIRLQEESQGDEIIQKFPGVYISAITDPKTISLVGPAPALARVLSYTYREGLKSQAMHLQGKVHNPENARLAADLRSVCDQNEKLRLPTAATLRVPFRSNKTGKLLETGSLTHEVIDTVLVSKCEWYQLLTGVASDLERTGRKSHVVAGFGIGDVVSFLPFRRVGLTLSKLDVASFVEDYSPRRQSPKPSISHSFPPHAIAVVGVGGRFPGADNVEELWDLISAGRSKVRRVPEDRIDIAHNFRATQDAQWISKRDFYGNFIERVDCFDHAFFNLSSREAASMDPQQRLLLETAYQAMDCSGYLNPRKSKSGEQFGVFIGASLAEYLENTSASAPNAYTSVGTLRAFLSGRISYYFGWTGPSEVLDTACSSSLVAVNRACKAILAGECHMALAGGVNIMSSVHNFMDLGKAGFLSPTGQCKPFDQGADGYCRGEGVGLVVLKTLAQAVACDDQILGVITGSATNQSGLSKALTLPYPPALKDLYKDVLNQAGLPSTQISYVEAHGTGTQGGDPLEMSSIREIFGGSERENVLYVGSIKGNIGHLETAAGVTGLIKALLMLQKGAIPPLASHMTLNSKISSLQPDKIAIPSTLVKWQVPLRATCVNSYGAAGSNAALVLRESPSPPALTLKGTLEERASYPIILTASCQESLVAYADAMRGFLKHAGTQVSLADVAFTLAEKRQIHSCRWNSDTSSVIHLVEALERVREESSEVSQRPKKLVLAFSGQHDLSICLEKGFYDACPLFKRHLDHCNQKLQQRGFSAIIPAIFGTKAVSNIVALHCGIFSVQYSCAKSWIDSGLYVDAVVGHSLGELTAMAVSGVLALEDALELVAIRATLISDKWGLDQGAMLMIQASVETVQNIIVHSAHERDKPEIACFNALESQVIVGTDWSIANIESSIQHEPRFCSIRCKRLDVTHGFHSRLADGILDDLYQAAANFSFHSPSIALETCTMQPLDEITPARIRQHTREPVAFLHAVRRIEQRLGSCVWLEAGIDSPIIPMVKRAVEKSGNHSFQGMTVRSHPSPTLALSLVTANLWRESLPVSFWNFQAAGDLGLKQIWLPPYQFRKTRNWIPYVDHAAAMSRAPPVRSQDTSIEERQGLVRLVSHQDIPGEYRVHTETQRYQVIVRGHAVLRRPLCPASLYMEIAVMAATKTSWEVAGRALHFEGLNFFAALGVPLERNVSVTLSRDQNQLRWSFLVKSAAHNDTKSRWTTHAKGEFTLNDERRIQDLQRLVTDRISDFSQKVSSETIKMKRIYQLFSHVVLYSSALQGITKITLGDHEALAEIDVPTQAEAYESSVSSMCDAVSLDTFIQVVGVLINSSSICSEKEAFLTTAIDSVLISPTCDFERRKSWTVYAMFTHKDDGNATGDVFVLTREGTVSVTFMGVHFSKLPLAKLEKILDSTDLQTPSKKAPSVDKRHSVDNYSVSSMGVANVDNTEERHALEGSDTSPTTTTQNKVKCDSIMSNIKMLLASYVGLSGEQIEEDASIGELGLDSLAAVELADDLAAKYETDIKPEVILSRSVKQLCEKVFNPKKVNIPTWKHTSSSNESWESEQQEVTALSGVVKGLAPASVDKQILNMVADVVGTSAADLSTSMTLQDMGMDSLSLMELKTDMEKAFAVEIDDDRYRIDMRITDLLKFLDLGNESPAVEESTDPSNSSIISENRSTPPSEKMSTGYAGGESRSLSCHAFEVLAKCDETFNTSAEKTGFARYWAAVAPKQDELLLSYIVEAFCTLGVDLRVAQPGEIMLSVQHLPKHSKVVRRLWDILERLNITESEGSNILRTKRAVSATPSAVILERLVAEMPAYTTDNRLMAVTGSRLADCLTGRADPKHLLFGNKSSQKLLSDFYQDSPMFSTLTDHLLTFLSVFVCRESRDVIRILEVGAGFGGTTVKVAEKLQALGRSVQYTFTDVSTMLVKNARLAFAGYSWMDFQILDLESEPPVSLRGKYDLVLATNVMHATANVAQSSRRLRTLLKQGGLVVLSEITKPIDWHELVFGLLEGWWLATDGRKHPIQPAAVWVEKLKEAGFESAAFSKGKTLESSTQQLIVGSTTRNPTFSTRKSLGPTLMQQCHVEEVIYKIVDDVHIPADIYYPKKQPFPKAMPVALMFHGGGYMTLSKTAIRPAQTLYLLENGILPISFDYRLCPEVNLIDGPVADTRDALMWAQTRLPEITESYGFSVDTDRIVVIGWSSGGHLAMTTAWTALEAGLKLPRAILSFYGMSDFDSPDMKTGRHSTYGKRTMSLDEMRQSLSVKPITSYDSHSIDINGLGFIRPGDPRSELVLDLFEEGRALPMLLNGMTSDDWQRTPKADRIAAVSPIVRLRNGEYTVPTFIIHGEKDELLPCSMSARFEELLRAKGVKGGLLVVPSATHLFDLNLRPGDEEWESDVLPGYRFLLQMLE